MKLKLTTLLIAIAVIFVFFYWLGYTPCPDRQQDADVNPAVMPPFGPMPKAPPGQMILMNEETPVGETSEGFQVTPVE